MPKKKPPQNAYQLFLTDWKKQHEDALDAADLSQAEVLKLCEAAWKENPARQNHYKEIASKAKGKTIKLVQETKYTSFGDTVASKEAELQEIQAFIDKMILEIKTTVKDLASSSLEALVNHSFFLIHANYYIEWTAENKFIPCEVAIVEYSIADGIQDILHFFPAVDTPDGLLPLGYAFEAKDKADTTHQIPPPPFEPAEYDYLDLSSRVLNFLTKNGSTSIPPVYTMDDNMNHNHSKSTVDDFMELIRDFSGKAIRVYRLPLLFFELYNACSKFDFGTKKPFESEMSAQQELCLDHYLYVQDISCTFHTLLESDAHRFCSKSTVQRWTYILSEYCCREVGIQRIPGKHGPAESRGDDYLASTKQGRFGRTTRAAPGAAPGAADWGGWKGSNSPSEKSTIAARKDELFFKRAEEGGAAAKVYVPGKEAGVLSEVYKDPSEQYVEDAGIRLPKTRGKADMLRSRQKHVDLRGFTKDEFPQLGGAGQHVSQWEPRQPRDLTKDDFPALGARPKTGGGKQNGRVQRT